MAKTKKRAMTTYRLTKKELPKETGGQRRAVYDAIKGGAADAAAVREAVRRSAAFKGASETTLKQNAAWHVAQLRRDGFLSKGGTR